MIPEMLEVDASTAEIIVHLIVRCATVRLEMRLFFMDCSNIFMDCDVLLDF